MNGKKDRLTSTVLSVLAIGAFLPLGGACGGGGTANGNASAGTAGGAGSTSVVSCTSMGSLATDTGALVAVICEETNNSSVADQLRAECIGSLGGADAGFTQQYVFANGPCSRTGATGGCSLVVAGTTTTTWYYDQASEPRSKVEMLCAMVGEEFVPP